MRSNATVYIDAGYLVAAAATRLTGSSFRRGIQPDYPALIGAILTQAEQIAGRPVLRSHWYDAARDEHPDEDQRVIEMIPRVKLRLGRIGNEGQQKGVDLKIGLDMVTHARNGAIDTLVLVSGDDDLTEAVDQAQASGVEVIVLAVPDALGRPHGVSRHLQATADRLELISGESLDASIVRRIATTTPAEAVKAVHDAPAPSNTDSTAASSAATDATPHRPSPADLARQHSGASTRPIDTLLAPVPVYSSTSGSTPTPAQSAEGPAYDESIAQVARASLSAFLAYATQQQLASLRTNRPSIPRELDSTLLRDLSDALGIYTLSEVERHALRDAFWDALDTVEV
ncbi:NYN domain-containing protein [Demequina iriomotensis]|uniref:NYN domain-containing protein n=1 Tax=Demequina iriomotensis TaxID=1536641 RepID=UPI0007817FF1|nr:NYN domain-containing protein [Demequina iriomotensis]